MTTNAQCGHFGVFNHTEAQCSTKNPHLRRSAHMVRLHEEGEAANREWEAQHLARERHQKSPEQPREEREQRDLEREEYEQQVAEKNDTQNMVAIKEETMEATDEEANIYGALACVDEDMEFRLGFDDGTCDSTQEQQAILTYDDAIYSGDMFVNYKPEDWKYGGKYYHDPVANLTSTPPITSPPQHPPEPPLPLSFSPTATVETVLVAMPPRPRQSPRNKGKRV